MDQYICITYTICQEVPGLSNNDCIFANTNDRTNVGIMYLQTRTNYYMCNIWNLSLKNNFNIECHCPACIDKTNKLLFYITKITSVKFPGPDILHLYDRSGHLERKWIRYSSDPIKCIRRYNKINKFSLENAPSNLPIYVGESSSAFIYINDFQVNFSPIRLGLIRYAFNLLTINSHDPIFNVVEPENS